MSRFVPKSRDFEARVRDSFARQGAMALIGARLERLPPTDVIDEALSGVVGASVP